MRAFDGAAPSKGPIDKTSNPHDAAILSDPTESAMGLRNCQSARELRKSQTDAENKLWFRPRDRHLAGFKFRRQHAIGPYIVDFVCIRRRLVIELDGGQHAESVQYDERRTRYLQIHGWRVMRFWNHVVLNETEEVVEHVLRLIQNPPSP